MAKGLLLGTGTSTGVPVIGCRCPVCTSDDPRDRRTRCSCYLEANGVHLLVDAGPDFRQQALKHEIADVDAVLITHHHFDHVAGLDDLRPYLFEGRPPIPCFALADSARVLSTMFAYIFADGSYPGVPRLVLHEVMGPFEVISRSDPARSVVVTPIKAWHGEMQVLGYRIGDFAYLTDVSNVPVSSQDLLQGLDILVLDALRDKPHPMHLTIQDSVVLARRIDARQTWFIHMSHDISHAELSSRLPVGIDAGYDGLEFASSEGPSPSERTSKEGRAGSGVPPAS